MNDSESRYLNISQVFSNSCTALMPRGIRKPKEARDYPTPTHVLFAQYKECRAMLAIAVACADNANKPEVNKALREELEVRIVWLTNEIQQRLERL